MEISMKRVLSLLVAFVMVLSLIPASPIHVHATEGEEATTTEAVETTAVVEETTAPAETEHVAPTPTLDTTVAMIGDAEYDSLSAAAVAVQAVTSADDAHTVIDLVRDSTETEVIRLPDKKVILYLNGHDLTFSGGANFMLGYNGTIATDLVINGDDESVISTSARTSGYLFNMYNAATATLNSVTIDATSGKDAIGSLHNGTTDVVLTLNNCDISVGANTADNYIFFGGIATSATNGKLIINGGSFTFDDSAYYTDNAAVKKQLFYGVILEASNWTANINYAMRFTCHSGGFLHNCTVNISNSTNSFYFNSALNGKQPFKLTGTTAITQTSGYPQNPKYIYMCDASVFTVDGEQPTGVVEFFAKYNGEYYATVQEAVDAAATTGGTVTVSRSNDLAATLPVGVSLQVNSGISYTGEVTTDNALYTVDYNEETGVYTVVKNTNIVLSVWNGDTFVTAHESFDQKTLNALTSGYTAVLEQDYTLSTAASNLYNTFTLDLNGHTLTLSGAATISAMNKANVTIKNGTILENAPSNNSNRFTAGGATSCSLTFENVHFTNIDTDGTVYGTGTGTLFYVNPGKGTENTETGLWTVDLYESEMIFKDCELDYKDMKHAYLMNGYVCNSSKLGSYVHEYAEFTIQNFDVSVDNTDLYKSASTYYGQLFYGIDARDSYGLNVDAKYVQRVICRMQGTLADSSFVAENCKGAFFISKHAFVKQDAHAEDYAWTETPLHLTGDSTFIGEFESVTPSLIQIDASATIGENLIENVTIHYAEHNDVHYTTVADAITAAAAAYAESGEAQTVTLLGNNTEDISLPAGVVIVKNGFTCGSISCADGCDYTCVDNGNGTHTKTCASCGGVVTEEHAYGEGAYTEPVVGSVDGYWTYTCTAGCGYSYVVVDEGSSIPEGALGYIENEDGTKDYIESVATAVQDLAAGETLTLVGDAAESNVMVKAGTSLDLNGHTLTADAFVGFGEITGEGFLKVADKSNVVLPNQESTLALWVEDGENSGYQFVTEEDYNISDMNAMEGAGADRMLRFWAKMDTTSALYTLMENGLSDNDLTLVVRLSWTVNGRTWELDVNYTDANLMELYANPNATCTLSISNAEDFVDANLTYTILFVSEAGYEIVGGTNSWF